MLSDCQAQGKSSPKHNPGSAPYLRHSPHAGRPVAKLTKHRRKVAAPAPWPERHWCPAPPPAPPSWAPAQAARKCRPACAAAPPPPAQGKGSRKWWGEWVWGVGQKGQVERATRREGMPPCLDWSPDTGSEACSQPCTFRWDQMSLSPTKEPQRPVSRLIPTKAVRLLPAHPAPHLELGPDITLPHAPRPVAAGLARCVHAGGVVQPHDVLQSKGRLRGLSDGGKSRVSVFMRAVIPAA